MITKNLVVKIQNLVANHKSQHAKSNPVLGWWKPRPTIYLAHFQVFSLFKIWSADVTSSSLIVMLI